MTYSLAPLDPDPASKEKLDIIARLAGGIAHDYNNLLAVVLLHADLLAAHEDEAVKRRAREIKQAAQRASALTRQLLAFGGRQIMTVRPVDLHAELERLMPAFARVLSGNVSLVLRYGEGVRLVNSDTIYLEQVLLNVIKNAHDALPGGGEVTVSTSRQPGPQCRVVISVTDNGTGMDQQVLLRAFEPFFTTSKGKKTGLGLSTAFGLVKQMGGDINVESELGRGTTVNICLQEYQEVARAAVDEPQQASAASTETLLLVDDESMVRTASAEMLELFGFQVLEAADGFEALEICQESDDPIALALIDIEMEGMDGPTLAAKIREQWPGIQIMFMSGMTEDMLQGNGILAPGERFIGKPYDPDDLVERIRAMIDA